MKSQLLALIAAIGQAVVTLRQKANDSIKDLGPIEQIEQGTIMMSMFRQVGWIKDDLERLGQNEIFDKVDSMINAAVDEEINARITAGQLFAKADLDSQLETARNAGMEFVRAEIKAAKEKDDMLAARRAQIAAAFGADVAAAATVAILDSENFDTVLAAAQTRHAAVIVDFAPETAPAAYKQLMLAALTEESSFTTLHASLMEIKASTPPATGAKPTFAATAGTGAAGAVIPKKPDPVTTDTKLEVKKPY